MFEIIAIVGILSKPPNDHQKWLEIAKSQCSKFHEINTCHFFYSHLHFGMPQTTYFLNDFLRNRSLCSVAHGGF